MYCAIPKGMDFSTKFDTYIIAYCPDSHCWFITNLRFFYYEYDKEFATEEDAFLYFRKNYTIFYDKGKELLGDEYEHLPDRIKRCVRLEVTNHEDNRFQEEHLYYSKIWHFYLTGVFELVEHWG